MARSSDQPVTAAAIRPVQGKRQSGKSALPQRLRHAPAFLRAFAARLGAALAMIHVVLSTLFRACCTYLRAQPANGADKFASPRHKAGSKATDLRAIHIQFYAARHAIDIVLTKTRHGAVVTRRGAGVASIDAQLELFMRHTDLHKVRA